MEVALQHGVEGIDGECGGACSCATCHVHIEDDWLDTVGVARGDEADLLSDVEERRANSRLACQIKISDALDGIRVKVPARAVV
jgi:2Fe-2S ferredoxin